MIDVTTAIVVARPPGVVAGFAADPANAPVWLPHVERVEWHTPPPHRVGTRFALVLKTMTCAYEITEHEPGVTLTMRTDDGPFPMETTYAWEPIDGGATRMTIRTRAWPTGVRRPLGGFIAAATRRATQQDLRELKDLLERG